MMRRSALLQEYNGQEKKGGGGGQRKRFTKTEKPIAFTVEKGVPQRSIFEVGIAETRKVLQKEEVVAFLRHSLQAASMEGEREGEG